MRREYLSGLDDSLEDEGEQENSCLEDINHEDVLAPSKHTTSRVMPARTDKSTESHVSWKTFLRSE
jgi:hypothetical protein